MKIKLVSVGKVRSDPAEPLVRDYQNRIQKFLKFEDIVLKPDRNDRVVARMLKESKQGQLLIAMDELGKQYTSKDFAKLFSSWMNMGHGLVTFVIGGADGLPIEIKKKASLTIGLSKMTLPHRLARLITVEQIYRALCIIKNVPYQK